MAKDLYIEPRRKMKGVGLQNEVEGVELMKPMMGEAGEIEYEADLSTAHFDVAVDVGPSFRSQREAIVRSLTNLVAITQDPQTQAVLQAMIVMNMEGEGIADAREYFRKKLVEIGVLKPNEEDIAAAQQAAQNAQPDPNAVFIEAAAKKATAEATRAEADAIKTLADTELIKAKTVETLDRLQLDADQQMIDVVQSIGQQARPVQ
jgi:hypothetical protein